MSIFRKALKLAAPVAGFALGGPAGAMLGSAVSSGISGAENKAQANKLAKQQQQIAMGNWQDTAPLRSRALEMALAPRPPREDLSGMFADPGNPYARVNPRPEPSADLSRVAPAPSAPAPGPVPFFGGRSPVLNGMAARAMAGGMGGRMGGGRMLQRALQAPAPGRAVIGPDGLVRQPEGEL